MAANEAESYHESLQYGQCRERIWDEQQTDSWMKVWHHTKKRFQVSL